MAEAITIARPYAEAIFKTALAKQTLNLWSDMLLAMTSIANDESVKAIEGNPGVSAKQLTEIFIESCKDKLNDEGRNLIVAMAGNSRLAILPQVRELFEQLKAQHEGVLEAKIVSAFALDSEQLSKLIANLERKFKHKIEAQVSIDPELIGGVKVEVGDEILDGSVRGKLEAMAISLKS